MVSVLTPEPEAKIAIWLLIKQKYLKTKTKKQNYLLEDLKQMFANWTINVFLCSILIKKIF
tara:strand:- start:507 stop:689 length:183 start_codon:yes stop_codon:yes gene_type:complete